MFLQNQCEEQGSKEIDQQEHLKLNDGCEHQILAILGYSLVVWKNWYEEAFDKAL